MYLYKKRDNIIYELHPLSLILLTLGTVVLSLVVPHPLLLLALLAAVLIDLAAAGLWREARAYLLIGAFMSVIVILVNLLFNHNGNTVLISAPLPWPGGLNLSLEALIFALAMSLRLLVMLMGFCLFTYLVNPDQVVRYLARWGGNAALALAIVLRLLPRMVAKMHSIREVQALRGIGAGGGGVREKLAASRPLVVALLGDSLEESMEMAQSLQTRGFGVGRRVVYDHSLWSGKDKAVAITSGGGLALGMVLTLWGPGGFVFYPVAQQVLSVQAALWAAVIMLLFGCPAVLAGGWRLWHGSR